MSYFPVLVVQGIRGLVELRRSNAEPNDTNDMIVQVVSLPEEGPETVIELSLGALRGIAAEVSIWA